MTTTLFTNAHIATGEPGSTAASTLPLQDILVTDGVFTAFGPGLAQQYEAQGGDLVGVSGQARKTDAAGYTGAVWRRHPECCSG